MFKIKVFLIMILVVLGIGQLIGFDSNKYEKNFTIEYVPKEQIQPIFGTAFSNGKIIIRDDLPPTVKNFVKSHEIYHIMDNAMWGGLWGREFRANLMPGLKNPIGLIYTIKVSLTKERIAFYMDRFKKNY